MTANTPATQASVIRKESPASRGSIAAPLKSVRRIVSMAAITTMMAFGKHP